VGRAILRQAWADLVTFRFQNILVVLMLAGAATTVMLGLTVQRSASSPWERLFADTHGAHAWFLANEPGTDLRPIGRLDGVSETAGPYRTARAQITARGEAANLLVFAMPATLPRMGRPAVTAGRWLSGAAGEIVLDHNVAGRLGLAVGSTVALDGPPGAAARVPVTVVGLSVFPGRGPWPSWSPAASFTGPATLDALASSGLTGSAFAVRLADPAGSETFLRRGTEALPPGAVDFSVEWHRLRADAAEDGQLAVVLIGLFTVFALLAAALVIANGIGARVLQQARELGLLKAVGFTPNRLTLLILVEHLALGLVGAVIGVAAGLAFAPTIAARAARAVDVPTTLVDVPGTALLTVLGVEAAVALVVLWPAWRLGRLPTVRAITGGGGAAPAGPSRAARAAHRLRLPQPVVLAAKDTFGRPARAGRTAAALALTVAVTIVALAGEATLRRLTDDPTLTNGTVAATLDPGELDEGEVRTLLARHPEVIAVPAVTIVGTAAGIDVQATALGSGHERIGYILPSGRMFTGPGEAVVGQGLLIRLHRRLGDTFTLTVNGEPLTLRIVGRYLAPEHNGRTALVSLDTLGSRTDRAGPPSVARPPTGYLLTLTGEHPDPAALKAALERESGGQVAVKLAAGSDQADDARQIRAVLIGLTALVLIIGAISVLMTTALGVRERFHEIGVLKTIGVTPRQVVGSVIAGAAMLSLVAAIIGVPVGLGLSWLVVSAAGWLLGVGAEFGALPPAGWLGGLVLFVLGIAALAGAVPASQAARLRIIDATRQE
jgi:putative ABC transport system permease protein